MNVIAGDAQIRKPRAAAPPYPAMPVTQDPVSNQSKVLQGHMGQASGILKPDEVAGIGRTGPADLLVVAFQNEVCLIGNHHIARLVTTVTRGERDDAGRDGVQSGLNRSRIVRDPIALNAKSFTLTGWAA